MAVDSKALTPKVTEGSPYQLDLNQVQRAADSLLKHMKKSQNELSSSSNKKSLLPADSESSGEDDASLEEKEPIWMIVTTKKHIVDKKRLKPATITLPHPLHTLSATATAPTRICLITADPQRAYKDIVASPEFPPHLRPSISRVIGISKLNAKYKSFESKRQLAAQHDIFLADERIVTSLPQTLGKIFYKGGEKRPIPVELSGNKKGRTKAEKDSLGQKRKRETAEDGSRGSPNVGTAETIAREIERALNSALLHLSPSATTAIKVAHAGMELDAVSENVEAVCKGMMEKYIPQGWKNMRSIHLKGPNTMALPVWLANELWLSEKDVLDEKLELPEGEKGKKKKLKGSKRKLLTAGEDDVDVPESEEKNMSKKKRKPDVASDEQPAKKTKTSKSDDAAEDAQRKERLKKQKLKARESNSTTTDVAEKRSQEAPLKEQGITKKAKAVKV
ncbi:ribosomal protein L1 [Rhizodiscina lignyota]|uniref:Ribosomal protein L1 n=1 Tax=Rhizodiscina lignyota TaxID=1504668 RepID=A0A9P4ILF0_9PEZI|nr:ribosomal protein L1 [Rhizodiscina lignyota]